jgi:hypothetical protein
MTTKELLTTWQTLKTKILNSKRDKQERIRSLMEQSVLWEKEIDLVKKKTKDKGEELHNYYQIIKQLVQENNIKGLASFLEKDWVKKAFLSDII